MESLEPPLDLYDSSETSSLQDDPALGLSLDVPRDAVQDKTPGERRHEEIQSNLAEELDTIESSRFKEHAASALGAAAVGLTLGVGLKFGVEAVAVGTTLTMLRNIRLDNKARAFKKAAAERNAIAEAFKNRSSE